jgi:HPt (histidine-containing phosphotransfer) domain-containing protein
MTQDDLKSESSPRPVPSCLDAVTLDQLLGLDDGGTGLVAELFGLFQEDTPGRLVNLRKNLEAGEAIVVSELAHALKGAAGTMGAPRMRSIAQDIEKATKGGRIDPAVSALLPDLEASYQEACDGLRAYLST